MTHLDDKGKPKEDVHKIGEHGAVGFLTQTGLVCAECHQPIEEKPKECEHDNKSFYARSWRCSDCGSTGSIEPQPTPVPEELEMFERPWHNNPEDDYCEIQDKLNEVIRYLQQRSKE